MRNKYELFTMTLVPLIAVAATLVTAQLSSWGRASAFGWGAAALVYDLVVWLRIAPMNNVQTQADARAYQPPRWARIALINIATALSFVTVILLIIDGNKSHGAERTIMAICAMLAVFSSWVLVHTVFVLHYAALYYTADQPGGIDFNEDDPPRYVDFAYMAFSLGMTYQVADTNITSKPIRSAAWIQSWYAFIFGTFITATTINLAMALL